MEKVLVITKNDYNDATKYLLSLNEEKTKSDLGLCLFEIAVYKLLETILFKEDDTVEINPGDYSNAVEKAVEGVDDEDKKRVMRFMYLAVLMKLLSSNTTEVKEKIYA